MKEETHYVLRMDNQEYLAIEQTGDDELSAYTVSDLKYAEKMTKPEAELVAKTIANAIKVGIASYGMSPDQSFVIQMYEGRLPQAYLKIKMHCEEVVPFTA